MGHIDEVLTANTVERQFSAAIRAALTMGKRTLNHYYTKTDLSEVYRIAMGVYFGTVWQKCSNFFPVLHPRHKLIYFRNAGWSEKRCKAAHHVVRHTFELCYKYKECPEEQPEPVSVDKVRVPIVLSWCTHPS